jgi:hypothetical protein
LWSDNSLLGLHGARGRLIDSILIGWNSWCCYLLFIGIKLVFVHRIRCGYTRTHRVVIWCCSLIDNWIFHRLLQFSFLVDDILAIILSTRFLKELDGMRLTEKVVSQLTPIVGSKLAFAIFALKTSNVEDFASKLIDGNFFIVV